MKSTTLRRSNITREKVQMMEALNRYNRQHQDEDFYKSQNRKRYLFYLLENGDYNFSTKDASVYNLYSSFCADIKYMKYAAILE